MSFPLYFDENVDPELADRLRIDGDNVETAEEAGLSGAAVPDERQLQHAVDEGRVLFSHDLKTLPGTVREAMASGMEFPGVVLCDQRTTKELYDRLRYMLDNFDPETIRNSVVWLGRVPDPS